MKQKTRNKRQETRNAMRSRSLVPYRLSHVAKHGFTLMEMLVSLGIFSVLIVSAISITISIGEAQQKAANIQNIQDNIRFTLELITKELRQGNAYTAPSNCVVISGTNLKSCGKIQFTSVRGERVWYCLANNAILRRVDSQDTCETQGSALTSPDISISRLTFYIVDEAPGPPQPRVTVVLQGNSLAGKQKTYTQFNLQTTVTQRIRDL